jgi:hypothetical protein
VTHPVEEDSRFSLNSTSILAFSDTVSEDEDVIYGFAQSLSDISQLATSSNVIVQSVTSPELLSYVS